MYLLVSLSIFINYCTSTYRYIKCSMCRTCNYRLFHTRYSRKSSGLDQIVNVLARVFVHIYKLMYQCTQASEVGPQGPRSRPQYFGQLPFWGRRFFSIRDLFVLLPRHRKSHIVSFMCQYSNGLIIIDPCCQLLILVSILLLQFIDLGCSIEKNC